MTVLALVPAPKSVRQDHAFADFSAIRITICKTFTITCKSQRLGAYSGAGRREPQPNLAQIRKLDDLLKTFTIVKKSKCLGAYSGAEWREPGVDWIGLDWIGSDWIGLDWIRLDWIGLDWTGQRKTRTRRTTPPTRKCSR